MTHYISLTNEAGHVVQCPLWKLPQLVAAEVEAKKSVIEQAKAAEAAAEEARLQAEAVQREAEVAETSGLNVPFDLTARVSY